MAGDESYFHTQVNDVHSITALVGGFILFFGFVSLIIKERLYLSESLVATLVGIAIGPIGVNLLNPQQGLTNPHRTTLYFTEFVIAIQVMAAAIALPRKFWRDKAGSLALLFGPVMIWMWLVSALLLWLILQLTWSQSMILAACLAPTDPILANSIVTGRFADKYISIPIRQLLSGESAANDGLAIPFFELGILLMSHTRGEAWGKWFYRIWLYEVGVAIVFGIVVGFGAKTALRASERRNYIDKRSFLSVEFALALFVLGLASMLNLAGFLAIFVTGLTFAWDGWFTEETEEAHVQEVVDNLINLTFFIYFGVGALWYMSYAFEHDIIGEEGMGIIMWVVWCSVVVYGITAVLMHGLVRTLSVVRVYSGRSFNGRTLSFQPSSQAAAWPTNVPVAGTQISGPMLSPTDILNIHADRGPGLPPASPSEIDPKLLLDANTNNPPTDHPIHGLEQSVETLADGSAPPGILVRQDDDEDVTPPVGVDDNYQMAALPLEREGRYGSEGPDSDASSDASEADHDGEEFHETMRVGPLPRESGGKEEGGELGYAPGYAESGTKEEGDDGEKLVGVGVRFRRFDTR
ncbi:hypothetical protein HKX48_003966 [Thoreauomyces humboldtii]|nr:hypothetical protein HKX48_003966 [Thoreauomyces humboldtii]